MGLLDLCLYNCEHPRRTFIFCKLFVVSTCIFFPTPVPRSLEICVSITYQKETKTWETPEPEERYFLPFGKE